MEYELTDSEKSWGVDYWDRVEKSQCPQKECDGRLSFISATPLGIRKYRCGCGAEINTDATLPAYWNKADLPYPSQLIKNILGYDPRESNDSPKYPYFTGWKIGKNDSDGLAAQWVIGRDFEKLKMVYINLPIQSGELERENAIRSAWERARLDPSTISIV